MWVVGVSYGYFIVWIQGGFFFYERVEFDIEFCLNVVSNIILFYKLFVLLCLLGYRDIFECSKCSKVILEEDEISDFVKENSIFCDSCSIWWQLLCVDFIMSVVNVLDFWVCQCCLIDVVNINDIDIEDEFKFNFVQELE